jgi:hypothetical protein
VEPGAGDERAEADALGRGRQRRQLRPGVPRPALGPAVAAVEQVVAEPDRVEAAGLGRARDRQQLGPADIALDLRQLDTDPRWRNTICCAKLEACR